MAQSSGFEGGKSKSQVVAERAANRLLGEEPWEASIGIEVVVEGERGAGAFKRAWSGARSPSDIRQTKGEVVTRRAVKDPKTLPRNRNRNVTITPLAQTAVSPTKTLGTSSSVNYFFDQFKFSVHNAASETLNKMGDKIISYIKASMKEGNYRPYLSKRAKHYKGMAIAQKRGHAFNLPSSVRTRKSTFVGGKFKSVYITRQKPQPAWGDFERVVGRNRVSAWGEAYIESASKRESKKRWVKLGSKSNQEAFRFSPAGTTYATGSVRNKAGDIIGSRFNRLRESGQGLIHWSSAPGVPPAPDTEVLKNSLEFEVESRGKMGYTMHISAFTPYAKVLELGSAKAGIAPRPFIRPAVLKFMKKFSFDFAAECRKMRDQKTHIPAVDRSSMGADWSGVGKKQGYTMSPELYKIDKKDADMIKSYSKIYGGSVR